MAARLYAVKLIRSATQLGSNIGVDLRKQHLALKVLKEKTSSHLKLLSYLRAISRKRFSADLKILDRSTLQGYRLQKLYFR